MKLELVAKEPDIVTPIGLTFDQRGRLLVIESHTHFPPDDYTGPQFDRIRIVEDTDGDGRADRFRSFLDGSHKTMSIRRGPHNWIYVATRMKVTRARDTDGDGKADQQEVIASLQTDGDYPHNGLGGLCFDGKGSLYFGLGENLGKTYTLVGSDDTRISGGGEGGNIYRCRIDGSHLEQVATGFWNPFGICTDSVGRVFTVGNDPDASPPCRLVHVVNGGDYGYQFRYGRSGKHPLQAWDGELPGTLPMVAGTSEAPSAVLMWHGQLYSSSWGEYRVERYTLKSNGASVRGDREVVVQGDNQFRPVDFAVAPNGSLYFTDWVDRSYNVHGKGRIWRLSWQDKPDEKVIPQLSTAERHAQRASLEPDWDALRSHDPFLHHAAMMGLVNTRFLTTDQLVTLNDRQRLGVLEAARRSKLSAKQRDALISAALTDTDSSVVFYAVRWIADARLTQFRSSLEQLLSDKESTVALFKAVLATIEWLDTGMVQRDQIAGETVLIATLTDDSRPTLQAMALKILPLDHEAFNVAILTKFVVNSGGHANVRKEAARSLTLIGDHDAEKVRLEVAIRKAIPPQIRADLLAGVLPDDNESKTVLEQLTSADSKVVQKQAARLLPRIVNEKPDPPRPEPSDTTAWLNLLKQPGDSDAGWRVFFGQGTARCANCHRYDGRGADVGPDLTTIGKRMDRHRLVQSILQPSQEIAPRYVPWIVTTQSGRLFTGLSLGITADGTVEHFLGTDGKQFEIEPDQIESRVLDSKSIMPDELHEQLSTQDIRDLLELLSE